MAKRSTIPMAFLLVNANYMLKNPRTTPEQRWGVCAMIECALHESGCYSGFSYLPSAGLTGAGTVNVRVDDEYRRQYSPSLKWSDEY